MSILLVLCLILLVACCFTSDTIGYMLFFPPAVMIAVIMLYIVYSKLSALEKKLNISFRNEKTEEKHSGEDRQK